MVTVGGTMVSRILGLSKRGGPLSAYFDLTGQEDTTPRNSAMGRGLALEQSVLAMFAERDGMQLGHVPPVRASALPHAHATLDAMAIRDGKSPAYVVDAKTASTYEMGEDWGPDGSDRVPVEYQLQLLWYQGVCRAAGLSVADEALLPTLCGPEAELQWAARLVTTTGRQLALEDLDGTGLELRVYHVVWDADLFEEVNARVVRFLHKHVELRRPPEPSEADLAERDMRAVARGFRADPGKVLDFERLPPPEQALVLELLDATRQRKAWERAEEQAATRVKLVMGTAEDVRGLPGGARVTWRERQTGRVFKVEEPRRK